MRRFLHTVALSIVTALMALIVAVVVSSIRGALSELTGVASGVAGGDVSGANMFERIAPILALLPVALIIATSAAFVAVYMYRERR